MAVCPRNVSSQTVVGLTTAYCQELLNWTVDFLLSTVY